MIRAGFARQGIIRRTGWEFGRPDCSTRLPKDSLEELPKESPKKSSRELAYDGR